MRESVFEKEDPRGIVCGMCGLRKLSVCERPDGFANEVRNDPDAVHTVCDECDYQNDRDI